MALRQFAERQQLGLDQICFMGDDVNDLGALALAGLSACPADARPVVREQCGFVAHRNGGNGALRELVDMLLSGAAEGAGN